MSKKKKRRFKPLSNKGWFLGDIAGRAWGREKGTQSGTEKTEEAVVIGS